MKSFIILGLILSAKGFAASSTVPNHRKPASSAKVLYLKNSTTFKSCTDVSNLAKSLPGSSVTKEKDVCVWNLNGGILDGSKQKGDGGQAENQEPLFRAKTPLMVKNGFVRNNKNAATFYASNSGVNTVTWLTVGEDAVATSSGAVNFLIENCEFINNSKGDKSIQMNEAKDLRMYNNLVYGGITCARIGDSGTTAVSEVAQVGGNRFVSCDTAYHASKITVVRGNADSFENVRLKYKAVNGAVFK